MNRPARGTALALLALAACASTDAREFDFDPDTAVAVVVLDESYLVAGEPAGVEQLAEALDRAHARFGEGTRRSVLLSISLTRKTGETDSAFERRALVRKDEAQEILASLRVRHIQMGKPAPLDSPTEEERGGKRAEK